MVLWNKLDKQFDELEGRLQQTRAGVPGKKLLSIKA